MTKEQIEDKLNNFKKVKNLLDKATAAFIADVDIPLEIRWNLFIEYELGKTKSYIHHFNTLNDYCKDPHGGYCNTLNDFILNGDRFNKYETIYSSTVVEIIEEFLLSREEYYAMEEAVKEKHDLEFPNDLYIIEPYDPEYDENPENYFHRTTGLNPDIKLLNSLKEEILNSNLKAFYFDW